MELSGLDLSSKAIAALLKSDDKKPLNVFAGAYRSMRGILSSSPQIMAYLARSREPSTISIVDLEVLYLYHSLCRHYQRRRSR